MAAKIDFEETLSYLLAKVTTAFRNSLERSMGEIGLHGGQIFVLLELWNKDGLRQIDIANRLDLSAPTINRMLKGMIEINLITRERIDDDARSTRIFLTDTGHSMRPKVESQWVDLEESCLVGFSDPERLMLLNLLGRLRNTYTGRKVTEED